MRTHPYSGKIAFVVLLSLFFILQFASAEQGTMTRTTWKGFYNNTNLTPETKRIAMQLFGESNPDDAALGFAKLENAMPRMYIADAQADRLQVDDFEGEFKYGMAAGTIWTLEPGPTQTNQAKYGSLAAPQQIFIDDKDFIYVPSFDNGRIEVYDNSGVYHGYIGSMNWPRGVCVKDDKIYWVSNWYNAVTVQDLQGKILLRIGAGYHTTDPNVSIGYSNSWGNKPYFFSEPLDVAVDAAGNIWVVEYSNHRVTVYYGLNNSLATTGHEPGEFKMGIGHGRVWHKAIYSTDGVTEDPDGFPLYSTAHICPRRTWYPSASGYAWITNATSYAGTPPAPYNSDSNGNKIIYNEGRVTSDPVASNRINYYSPPGWGKHYFYYPRGITIDADGYVYITDFYNYRFLVYDINGNFIRGIGYGTTWTDAQTDPATDWAIGAESDYNRHRRPGAFANILGHAAVYNYPGVGKRIIMTDYDHHRIQAFDANGAFKWGYGSKKIYTDPNTNTSDATIWRKAGWGNAYFWNPVSAAVDSKGNIYVLDYNTFRIKVIRPYTSGLEAEDMFLRGIGQSTFWRSPTEEPDYQKTSANGCFRHPRHVAVDETQIYVIDNSNYRIQVFNRNTGGFKYAVGSGYVWTSSLKEPPEPVAGSAKYYFNGNLSIACDDVDANANPDLDGFFYVADPEYNRILKFRKYDGTFARGWGSGSTWSEEELQAGTLTWPNGCTNSSGKLYFRYVLDLVVDKTREGYVYVAEYSGAPDTGSPENLNIPYGQGNNRIQVIKKSLAIGEPKANAFVMGLEGGTGVKYGPADAVPQPTFPPIGDMSGGKLLNPYALALDALGNLYVLEWERQYSFYPNPSYWEGRFRFQKLSPLIPGDTANSFQFLMGAGANRCWGPQSSNPAGSPPGYYYGDANGYLNYPRGIDVDAQGRVYVASWNGQCVHVFSPQGNFIYGIGGGRVWDASISKPYCPTDAKMGYFWNPHGIAVDSEGYIYVTDFYNFRVQIFNPFRGSADDGKPYMGIGYSTSWNAEANVLPITGTENGYFTFPSAVSEDGSGNIYVADTASHRIQIFDSAGNFARGIGNGITWDALTSAPTSANKGTGGAFFSFPRDVAITGAGDNLRIAVADMGNHRIQVFDKNGVFRMGIGNQTKWTVVDLTPLSGLQGTDNYSFYNPSGLAYDKNGNLFVADSGNNRIMKYSPTGAFLLGLGSGQIWGPSDTAPAPARGTGMRAFDYPCGIKIDNNLNIYVADTNNHRILIFDQYGNFLRGIGNNTSWTDGAYVWSPEIAPVINKESGYLSFPYDVDITIEGNIFVADTGNHRLQRFGGLSSASPGIFQLGIAKGTAWESGETAPNPEAGYMKNWFNAPTKVAITATTFYNAGSIGGQGLPAEIPLRFDAEAIAGPGAKVTWKYLSWDADFSQIASPNDNYAVKFKVRSWNAPADLYVNRWYGRTSSSLTAIGWADYYGRLYSESRTTETINVGVAASRYLDVLARLESDGYGSPILNSVSVLAEYLVPPAATSLTQHKGDTPTTANLMAKKTWINTNTLTLKIADVIALGGNTYAEIELKPSAASFNETSIKSSNVLSGVATKTFTTTETNALIAFNKSYKWRVRITDYPGNRVSAWREAGDGTYDFGLDNTVPEAGGITYAASQVTSGSTFSVVLDKGIDKAPDACTDASCGASGIKETVLQKASTSYLNNAYTFPGTPAWTDVTTVLPDAYTGSTYTYTVPSTELSAYKAYKFRLVVRDNAGNETIYTSGNVVAVLGPLQLVLTADTVDNTMPAGSSLHFTVLRQDAQGNIKTSGNDTVTLTSNSASFGGHPEFNQNDTRIPLSPANQVVISNGYSSAGFYYYDTNKSTVTITASAANFTDGTKNITILSGATAKYELTHPSDVVAGTWVEYTVTRKDQFDNVVNSGVYGAAETLTLTSTPASGSILTTPRTGFSSVAGGNLAHPGTITIPANAGSITFAYLNEKMGAYTIQASKTGVATPGTDDINVTHYFVHHLQFASSISDREAGTQFELPQLRAVDMFGNICQRSPGNSTDAYEGDKTVTYTLASGIYNAPNGTPLDTWTTALYFNDGLSSTPLTTRLYRAQTTTLLARASDIPAAASGEEPRDITIKPAIVKAIAFNTQPTQANIINAAFTTQPVIWTLDQYGNKSDKYTSAAPNTAPTVTLTVSRVNTGTPNPPTPIGAALKPDINTMVTVSNGVAVFNSIYYNKIAPVTPTTGESPIYIAATTSLLEGIGSSAITYSNSMTAVQASTSSVEKPDAEITKVYIDPTKDSDGQQFVILRFKIKDAGVDQLPTLVDRIRIQIACLDAVGNPKTSSASQDIAYAELLQGGDSGTKIKSATSASGYITDSEIIFGDTTPNNDSVAQLTSVGDNTTVDFTVKIYMTSQKLTAQDKDTYAFNVDETNIKTDGGYSSFMTGDTNQVKQVNGQITVTPAYFEILAVDPQTGLETALIAVNAGSSVNINMRAVDANHNLAKSYTATKSLRFGGLAAVTSGATTNTPTVNGVNVDNATLQSVTFFNGQKLALPLVVFAAETALLSAAGDATMSSIPLQVVVAAGPAEKLTRHSGHTPEQSGVINAAVKDAFKVFVSDNYGNPISGVNINFAITGVPAGTTIAPSLSRATDATKADGTASTLLTLGNMDGRYTVTATAPSLAGTPSVAFTAQAVSPSTVAIISGHPQTKVVVQNSDALVVEVDAVAGAVTNPVSNVNVTFAISIIPAGATGQRLSSGNQTDVVTTGTDGRAQTVLTLGNKSGEYRVTATYGSYSADFVVTANPAAPNKIVIAGPTNITAGATTQSIGPYTLTIRDQYDNNSPVPAAVPKLSFSLGTNSPTAPGAFYLDASPTAAAVNIIDVATGASSVNFYYKNDVSGNLNLMATQAAPQTLPFPSIQYPVTVLPAGLDHFEITGETTPLVAGAPRQITISGYDNKNNLKTDYNAAGVSLIFSGATASPSPSLKNPTVNDVAFGSPTSVDFSAGVATVTVLLYKVETADISVTDGNIVQTPVGKTLSFPVRHALADHLKFGANLPATVNAGAEFRLGTTIDAVDLYDNICNSDNGAAPYNGIYSVTFRLSGASNGPEKGNDAFPASVTFQNGRSNTTELPLTLYRAQDTTLSAGIASLPGSSATPIRDVASNTIRVRPDKVDHLRFSVLPTAVWVTNVAMLPKPKVAVADEWGNPVPDASGQVTLRSSSTDGVFTRTTNGYYSGIKNLSEGQAEFGDVLYTYPEVIYLEASASIGAASLPPIYSSVKFSTEQDVTVSYVPRNGDISSLAVTPASKGTVLSFKLTDAGGDGYPAKIRQIAVRNASTGATAAWTRFIANASITDGVTEVQAYSIADNRIAFGSGTGVIFTVDNNSMKTFTLKVMLKSPLPAGADDEVLNFKIDAAPETGKDITMDAIGSQLASDALSITDTAVIRVMATNFKLTGPAELNAGSPGEVTLQALDIYNNIDEGYAGDKTLVFSGASLSRLNNAPTVQVGAESALAVNFADSYGVSSPGIIVSFKNGVNDTVGGTTPLLIKLFRAEVARIRVYDPAGINGSPVGTLDTDALVIIVRGGDPSQLSWLTQPRNFIVANAPFGEFVIGVTDAYGNTASSEIPITINVSGGTYGDTSTSTVTAVSGEAHFDNFTVKAAGVNPSYPVFVNLQGTVSGGAPGVSDTSLFGPVTVDAKYDVTINVKDSVTNSSLPDITYQITSGQTIVVNPTTATPPFKNIKLFYGRYTISMDKDKYVQANKDVVAGVVEDMTDGANDNKITWTIYMTSIEEATADYQVKSTFVYDETINKLSIRMWLERRGKLVLNLVDSVNKLGKAQIKIFDETKNNFLDTLEIPAPAATEYSKGVYSMEITNVTKEGSRIVLSPGKVYFANCSIDYGDPEAPRHYETGTTFAITTGEAVKQIQAMSTDIQAQVAGVRTQIAAESGTIQSKVAAVKAETQQILTATTATLPAKIDTATAAVMTAVETFARSEILNRETIVMKNTTATIRFRTYENASPVITVYDPDNVARVVSAPMREVQPGLYEYAVKFAANWPLGEYSIVCSEPNYGTMDAICLTLTQADIESLSSDVSAVLGSVTPIRELKDKVDAFSAAFNVIESNIAKATEALAGVKAGAKDIYEASSMIQSLYESLKEMSAKIKELGGTAGYNLEKLYEVSETRSKDIGYIRNKTQELKALLLLNQQMVENTKKEDPAIQTWFEYR